MKLDEYPPVPSMPAGMSEPVFNEPWEASAFAITVSLNQAGLFKWTEWVEFFSQEIKAAESAPSFADKTAGDYYCRWVAALEKLVVAKELLDLQKIDARQRYLRDNPPPHDHVARRDPVAIA